MSPETKNTLWPRIKQITAVFVLGAGMILAAGCGRKDSTPTTTNVWRAGVGDALCPGVTVHELDWENPENKFQGIKASAINAAGAIYPLEVGTTISCNPNIKFWVTGMANNGSLGITGLVQDYN